MGQLESHDFSFQRLFWTALDALFIVDLHSGQIVLANPAAERLIGVAPGAAIARPATTLVPESHRAALEATMKSVSVAAESQAPLQSSEWPIQSQDQEERWVELRLRPIDGPDGRAYAVMIARDVTERRRALDALRASEQRLALVVTQAPLVLFALDPQGVFTLSEGKSLTRLGFQPGQAVGLSVFEVHADAPKPLEDARRALAGEALHSIQFLNGMVFDAAYQPQFDERGQVIGVIGVSTEITERHLAEVALRRSEERLRRQYKGNPLPTHTWRLVGADLILEDFNDAARASATDGQVSQVGMRVDAFYRDAPTLLAELRTCAREQQTVRCDAALVDARTGRARHLVVTFVPLPPDAVMAHTEDVTDRVEAQQRQETLARVEKLRALGQMAAGIAHDLNQSLGLIMGHAELALQALERPDQMTDSLRTIMDAALGGADTLKRLLSFTRTGAQGDAEPVHLGALLREVAQLTAPRWRDTSRAEGRPISLTIETDGADSTILGWPASLREALINLIFNAVDALPEGGTIQLRAYREGPRALVQVADSGIGMSAEVKARLFEPFFSTKGERGTGLGLPMVFGIVERHQGTIQVDSVPGRSTTFTLSFSAAVARDDPPLPAGPSNGAVVGALRILVVDDDVALAGLAARLVETLGHTAVVASSGEESLDRMESARFDIVLSDLGMGEGMNGWALVAEVRRAWPRSRFALATGWGAQIDPIEARTRAVDAVLAKPYRMVELQRLIADLLDIESSAHVAEG